MKANKPKKYTGVERAERKANAAPPPNPLNAGLPPGMRERRDARRKAALAEAEASWTARREREQGEEKPPA